MSNQLVVSPTPLPSDPLRNNAREIQQSVKGTYQMVDFERQSVGLRHGVGSTPVRAACTRNNHGERKKH